MFRSRNNQQSAVALFLVLAVAAASLAFPACQKREKPAPASTTTTTPPPAATTPAVIGVELGNGIQASKRVVQAQTTFNSTDTIYAAVMTEGNAASATLSARWTFEDGQLVDESSQTIVMSGPATTEFHIMKPSGWPAGRYQVQISLNGVVARTVEFTVQ
jgi:hypothetical protein